MKGLSDFRLPAAMFGLASADLRWGMLANSQSEPPYAVLGLGTGILGCYAKPFQTVDFTRSIRSSDLSVVPGYLPPWIAIGPRIRNCPIRLFLRSGRRRTLAPTSPSIC